ncbi:MAG: hypothetical protein QOH95_2009 [Gaiellaceae bacterium]|jgi:hypothetical protein|nr:hypothetical protein [Gaiellaceae bacterium]
MKLTDKKYGNFLCAIIGFMAGLTGILTVSITSPFH